MQETKSETVDEQKKKKPMGAFARFMCSILILAAPVVVIAICRFYGAPLGPLPDIIIIAPFVMWVYYLWRYRDRGANTPSNEDGPKKS